PWRPNSTASSPSFPQSQTVSQLRQMSRSPDIQATCWAYADDGRICRRPATVFDPQRGFFVCAAHNEVRENEQQTPNRMTPMSKSKSDRKSTRLNSSHLGISYAVF